MTASNFIQLASFMRLLSRKLLLYASCSFDDFILSGQGKKFEKEINALFNVCFGTSSYRLVVKYQDNSVCLDIVNISTSLSAFSLSYDFSA